MPMSSAVAMSDQRASRPILVEVATFAGVTGV
jgi:hypothetical protein